MKGHMDKLYFQDEMVHNNCFGCGPSNERGLRIKSYWDKDGSEAVCIWRPEPYHLAGPEHVLNGGIIATIIDCHSICTAIAHAYAGEGRAISTKPVIWCVTASLRVSYMKPTPIGSPVELRARVIEESGKKSVVECSLSSLGVERAAAEVLAIRVPAESWYDAHG